MIGAAGDGADAPTAGVRVKVWDPFVRLGHWALVASTLTAWLTHEGPPALHDRAGYLALGIVVLRVLWGFIGPPHSRFKDFVRGVEETIRYARAWLRGDAPHYLGHNPLGGWMILALLATIATTSVTGWLLTTDWFWGSAIVESLHAFSARFLLFLIVFHVGGVLLTSWRGGENLVAAMIHGKKRVR